MISKLQHVALVPKKPALLQGEYGSEYASCAAAMASAIAGASGATGEASAPMARKSIPAMNFIASLLELATWGWLIMIEIWKNKAWGSVKGGC